MTGSTSKTHSFQLRDFPIHSFDKIRYADTDRQGHVNNAVFSTFLETGRAEFLYDPDRPLIDENAAFVIANLSLNYIGEIRWPGRVEIGTGVLKIGNSSMTLQQAVFYDDNCVATAQTIIVQMDETTRKSKPLKEASKQFLSAMLI